MSRFCCVFRSKSIKKVAKNRKNKKKVHFFCKKIWSYKNNVVLLHRQTKKNKQSKTKKV